MEINCRNLKPVQVPQKYHLCVLKLHEEERLTSLTSVLTGKTCLQQFQAPEASEEACGKEDLLSVEEDRVREHLNKLDIHESMGPNRMYP